MHLLEIDSVTKQFPGTAAPAVQAASFHVEPGELFGLVGPSGCGKTTLLRLIAGFETLDSGSICLRNRDITGLPPEKRKIGFMFQDYALFPHLTVLHNVLFALKHIPKKDRIERAMEYITLVGLDHLVSRMPHQLSGGQQQRTAIARALAAGADLLLMDEPFSNLDVGLREATRREVKRILRKANTNAILVTHDQDEALSFCDRLGVMDAGRILQTGTPEELYSTPKSSFTATFLGRANLLKAVARGELADSHLGTLPITPARTGEVLLAVRPEHIALGQSGEEPRGRIIGKEFRGHDITYRVHYRGRTYIAHTDYSVLYNTGDSVTLSIKEPALVIEEAS